MRNRAAAMLAAVSIPLSSVNGWQVLKFSKIPPNGITFAAPPAGLTLNVKSSASPLVYPLPRALNVKAFRADVSIEGSLKSGGKFPDDAYLRVGLIVPGSRRLNWMERQMAPDWITKLFALAPKNTGLDKVYFFNLIAEPRYLRRQRLVPGSRDLIFERNVAARGGETHLSFAQNLAKPLRTAALWLASDGDDTGSSFTVHVHALQLETD